MENKKSKNSIIFFIVGIAFIVALCVILASSENTNTTNSNINTTNTTPTTPKDDNSMDTNNSIVEESNISFTGMRFNTNWTELKKQIDNYNNNNIIKEFLISDWNEQSYEGDSITEYSITYYKYRNPTLEESAMGLTTIPYSAFQFTFTVEDSSNKLIALSYCFLDPDSISERFNEFRDYMLFIDTSLWDRMKEFISLWGEVGDYYYADNIYIYTSSGDSSLILTICAANDEEVNYHREDGHWRAFNNISRNTDTSSSTTNKEETNGSNGNKKENNINNKNSSGKTNTSDVLTGMDVLNDTNYFTKYKLVIIDNAENMRLETKRGYANFVRSKVGYAVGPEFHINSEILDTGISNVSILTKSEYNELLEKKLIYYDKNTLYLRNGIKPDTISVHFGYEYNLTYDDDYETTAIYEFDSKVNINGNTITLTIDPSCITGNIYG